MTTDTTKAGGDGGPAFPRPYSQHNDANIHTAAFDEQDGMTLRDYFAAKALEAILRQLDRGIRPQDCIRAAEDAYFMADSMLKARQQ